MYLVVRTPRTRIDKNEGRRTSTSTWDFPPNSSSISHVIFLNTKKYELLKTHPFTTMKAINKDYQSLPSPKQTWAHSTCTIKELLDAVNDPSITAIEADIVMGFDVNDNTGENDNNIGTQPIMAHPPLTESDLSFKTFLNIVCNDTHEEKNVIKKHVKLDFKTISTVRPVLELLKSQCTSSSQTTFRKEELKTIYLNADIIHGPGARYESMEISYDEFIKLCLSFLKSNESLKEQVCQL